MHVNAALVTNRGQTYVIYNDDSVALLNECDMTVNGYHTLQSIFPGIPPSPTLAFRYIDGSLYFLHKLVRILERRYPLTVTGYKYLTVGIDVKLPSVVTIVLGDCHGKEMSLSPTVWSVLVEKKNVTLPLLQYEGTKDGQTKTSSRPTRRKKEKLETLRRLGIPVSKKVQTGTPLDEAACQELYKIRKIKKEKERSTSTEPIPVIDLTGDDTPPVVSQSPVSFSPPQHHNLFFLPQSQYPTPLSLPRRKSSSEKFGNPWKRFPSFFRIVNCV
ncbi:hypothetical protein ALC62_13546 [Cyphomyrmex costatus]|uniref:Uncharacterized protein n=1 Tax=Cyphomyrmex costatus TaxID=456900 RepID=A0A151I9X2_9HYME|nr:hypothetical protein ALC62_13546 [Cyphomyrmex costatus]